jgi:hypothetical protein
VKRIINPITKKTYGGRSYRVFISIEYIEGKLRITGVEGPLPSGDALGACGQIDTTLRTENRENWKYVPGWNAAMVDKLLEVWDRWHLNDMRAGTPKQETFLREWRKTNKGDYSQVCSALEAAGLLIDDGYKYGSAWLKEEVPQDIIQWLFSLPVSKVQPAWI